MCQRVRIVGFDAKHTFLLILENHDLVIPSDHSNRKSSCAVLIMSGTNAPYPNIQANQEQPFSMRLTEESTGAEPVITS